MKNSLILFTLLFLCACSPISEGDKDAKSNLESSVRPDYVIVLHGGAGTIVKENLTPELEKSITKTMNDALEIGKFVLDSNGTAMDAIQKVIMHLENSPHFNAGKGAVFTHDGEHELDASIMDGKTMDAGAVGGIKGFKNPILAAKAVMDNSPHVMLSGTGANTFCKEQGLEMVDKEYFYTERRWKSLQSVLEKEKNKMGAILENQDYKYGTVGCAVLDKHGNLAAGTSTGGMTNKRWGRIGDAPIIGAGTYANNNTCAISATGHGEYFIRYAVAHDISARMEHGGVSFNEASKAVVNNVLVDAGGSGGIIGVDKDGNVAMPFNTKGMYRAYLKSTGERYIGMFKD